MTVSIECSYIEIIIIAAHPAHHSQVFGCMPSGLREYTDGAFGYFVVADFSEKFAAFEIGYTNSAGIVITEIAANPEFEIAVVDKHLVGIAADGPAFIEL